MKCSVFGCESEMAYRHHLVPRALRTGDEDRIPLCGVHHGKAHARKPFPQEHAKLSSIGVRRAQASGKQVGRLGLGRSRSPDGRLAWDAEELRSMERMWDLRASGSSLRTICATLKAEGHRTQRGGAWRPGTVAKVLDRMRRAVEEKHG